MAVAAVAGGVVPASAFHVRASRAWTVGFMRRFSCFRFLSCFDLQAAVGFLGHFAGAVGWACELPTLAVSMVTLVLAFERQDFAGGVKASKQFDTS